MHLAEERLRVELVEGQLLDGVVHVAQETENTGADNAHLGRVLRVEYHRADTHIGLQQ